MNDGRSAVGPVFDRTPGVCVTRGGAHENGPVGDWTYPQARSRRWSAFRKEISC